MSEIYLKNPVRQVKQKFNIQIVVKDRGLQRVTRTCSKGESVGEKGTVFKFMQNLGLMGGGGGLYSTICHLQ